jgi:hypothetical protein
MSNLIEKNKMALLSLGFAFQGKLPKQASDPEKTIIQILPAFFEDRKLFRMLLTWLDIVSDLIHIERLIPLATNLDASSKIVLAAISLKLQKRDRRWRIVHQKLEKEIQKDTLIVPPEYRDQYLISKYGVDEEFRKMGVRIAKILPEDEKKILSLQGVLKANEWLRLRALMGPNFRADIAFLFLSELVSGPAEASRYLGCARDTAYRNWRALEAASVKEFIQLSA